MARAFSFVLHGVCLLPLNLISDAWIPVSSTHGRRIIRPDQIAEPDVLFPDWPRADLNIACLELLIGLVHLADPVEEVEDWADRKPDPERLRAALAPLAPAFDLGGDGPRFLQDRERFETANAKVDINSPDMLFIDSAGGNTAKNNADLMVRRGRYPRLDPALAAMALYTLQSQAPAGGAGNRTSMRGGGPMITLVEPPEPGLWPLVWANVPLGRPQGPEALPWMQDAPRPDPLYPPEDGNLAETFFGMPRRLRLIFYGDQVTGVLQKPYGANYAGWEHPLTPYYRVKDGAELLPQHPRAGAFGYRNWLGINAASTSDLRRQAAALTGYADRAYSTEGASVIVAGWAMDNMKPRDFTLSRQPLIPEGEALTCIQRMIAAAKMCGETLATALKMLASGGTALDALREEFFLRTQGPFERLAGETGHDDTMARWLAEMHKTALAIFDDAAMPGLAGMPIKDVEAILRERNLLIAMFRGQGKTGAKLYGELGLEAKAKAA
ncbi:type I-E CRISPR-associated protein Cse1/CasA [Paracoccus lichenicola]|uniref:type I-E CRISPR-associated protein Cse1/CasA n=1 Tax=Paracoccus lichenicola TaxID=2665644 RepID=UPI0012B70CC2|nr:type I-E CRISPR-associated protein Cse1/CasA [Paracoccus lichenicola]